MAIENTGLKISEIISLIESKDLIINKAASEPAIALESEPLSTHFVAKNLPLDSCDELQKFQPECCLERTQLHSGDMIKTEVIIDKLYITQ